jgi:hypothetical protein
MVDPDKHSVLVPMGRLAGTFSNDALTTMLASVNKVAAARPQSASNDSDQAPAKVDGQMGEKE